MRRFVTQKLSWNRTNRFPHHTFWWEGLDGSRVLTHFPPVDTYGAEITPKELAYSVERFAEHAWSGWSLVPYGYGDGGGGPTREMLERAGRLADLDGMPNVELGSPGDVLRPRRGRGGRRRAGAGVARRAVLRDPSRHVDEPAPHEARQPSLREAAARAGAVGRHGSRPRRARRSARARPPLARGVDAAVPRHPPGLVDRLGARRRRGGLRPHRRRSRAAHRRPVGRHARTAIPRWRTRRPSIASRSSPSTASRPATGRLRCSPTAAPHASCGHRDSVSSRSRRCRATTAWSSPTGRWPTATWR